MVFSAKAGRLGRLVRLLRLPRSLKVVALALRIQRLSSSKAASESPNKLRMRVIETVSGQVICGVRSGSNWYGRVLAWNVVRSYVCMKRYTGSWGSACAGFCCSCGRFALVQWPQVSPGSCLRCCASHMLGIRGQL